MSHPKIAAIHSVEEIEGRPVLVLELVEGPTLAARVASGPLPPAEALQIAGDLAEARPPMAKGSSIAISNRRT